MTFKKIYTCGEKSGETEIYDQQKLYTWLSVNYGIRTAKSLIEDFKCGRRQQFVAWWGRFEVIQEAA